MPPAQIPSDVHEDENIEDSDNDTGEIRVMAASKSKNKIVEDSNSDLL